MDRRRMRDANESEIEFAAYIGIDWAEQKHACALQSSTAPGVEESELLHKPEAVEAWATELYRRFGGRPIAIALEQSRGSLLFMLLKYEHLVLFPVKLLPPETKRGPAPSEPKAAVVPVYFATNRQIESRSPFRVGGDTSLGNELTFGKL